MTGGCHTLTDCEALLKRGGGGDGWVPYHVGSAFGQIGGEWALDPVARGGLESWALWWMGRTGAVDCEEQQHPFSLKQEAEDLLLEGREEYLLLFKQ